MDSSNCLLANELKTDLFNVLVNKGWGVMLVINDVDSRNLFDNTRGKRHDVARVGFEEFNKKVFDKKAEFNITFNKFVLEYK
jgi:hypothetical protein